MKTTKRFTELSEQCVILKTPIIEGRIKPSKTFAKEMVEKTSLHISLEDSTPDYYHWLLVQCKLLLRVDVGYIFQSSLGFQS